MSVNNNMVDLKKRLNLYRYRTKILYVTLLSYRFNSRLRFILNKRGEFHLNDCVWSSNNATEGPDTCHCHKSIISPDQYFTDQIKKQFHLNDCIKSLDYGIAWPDTCHCRETTSHQYFIDQIKKNSNIIIPIQTCDSKKLLLNDKQENDEEFYNYRVLDFENVPKWYELYKKMTNVLQFQITIRELNKENEIDTWYNEKSNEWHLTDCIRCVAWDKGPNICPCETAMMDPLKYLTERYNYIDIKKYLEAYKKMQVPCNFKRDYKTYLAMEH